MASAVQCANLRTLHCLANSFERYGSGFDHDLLVAAHRHQSTQRPKLDTPNQGERRAPIDTLGLDNDVPDTAIEGVLISTSVCCACLLSLG